MITLWLSRWADAALRAENADLRRRGDRWKALAVSQSRKRVTAERAVETLQAVCDRYSQTVTGMTERLQQMREGK